MDETNQLKITLDQLTRFEFANEDKVAKTLFMRFPRERRGLELAATLLANIKADKDKLDAVLGLQQLLIFKIAGCDIRIARLQKAQQRIPRILARPEFRAGGKTVKVRSSMLKKLRKGIMGRIREVRHLAYLWRCFGDGIASVYQSQHALRHLLYDAQYAVKPTAGALYGKEGFGHEYAMLQKGIEMGVPVVMSDLTNIIRHGDLCALAGPDPVPLELKSSRLTGSRVARQAEQLNSITSFYENDEARDFRGMNRVIRTEVGIDEVDHRDFLNVGMQQALVSGFWSDSPEPGLRYICYQTALGENPERVMKEIDLWITPSTWVMPLGPDFSWLPAYPFTLSMLPQNAVLFMQEAIAIVVLSDLEIIKRLFRDQGVHCVWLMNGSHAMQICVDPNDLMKGAFRISECLFRRVSTEFLSISWFVREQSRIFNTDQLPEFAFSDLDPDEIISEPIPGWAEARDFYE
ncbi:hypothetical protein F6476_34230 [Pseudomonas umsongensis]|uniref:hypothetical protein n=1 Tax=Pseudomonas TaxID=286 RepID=UPI001248AFDC|nr:MULTISPECIES: hypothetical protein [Pseudomonas]MDZ5432004.1 hypothetical protein [Pseudomonas fluorescens]QFG33901.1 hypothetical protein F6476_34230 [Pseudomonas umsongensis]